MPAKVFSDVIGKATKTDISVLPSDIFGDCTATDAALEVIKVTQTSCEAQKWLALDVIGAFSMLTTSFSIDSLSMWVYAVDGEYITPQKVQAMSVTNGDRFSLLVQLKTPGDYTVRVASTWQTQVIAGVATIQFKNAGAKNAGAKQATPTVYIDDAGINKTADVAFFSQKAQKAFPPKPVAKVADKTFRLALNLDKNHTYNWALNGTMLPAKLDAAEPFLFAPHPADFENVTISTLNGNWVDLILVTATIPMPPHPIHKHGNKMFLIGQGVGAFNWSSTAEAMAAIPEQFNLVDPPMRDGFSTIEAIKQPSWMVIRYQASLPGAWILHCHIESHMLGGMAMVIQDGINAWPLTPVEYSSFNA